MYGTRTNGRRRSLARRARSGAADWPDDVQRLRKLLGSKDGIRRQHARMALVRRGESVVSLFVDLLLDGTKRERWEAAKALTTIGDSTAAPALVAALMDDDEEIRWLAAEGLIALGTGAVVPLMEGLERNFDSVYLLQGTHHVLHALEREHKLSPSVQGVLDELRSLEPDDRLPWAARAALLEIMNNQRPAVSSQSRRSVRRS